MSLVSNFIGGISGAGVGGIKTTTDFNLDDTTFAELLQKQLEKTNQEDAGSILGQLGVPAGLEIEPLEGIEDIKISAGSDFKDMLDSNKDGDVTSSEMLTFFSSLLDNNTNGQNNRSELFNFTRKQAANLYNQYSRNVITDVAEFVTDALHM